MKYNIFVCMIQQLVSEGVQTVEEAEMEVVEVEQMMEVMEMETEGIFVSYLCIIFIFINFF